MNENLTARIRPLLKPIPKVEEARLSRLAKREPDLFPIIDRLFWSEEPAPSVYLAVMALQPLDDSELTHLMNLVSRTPDWAPIVRRMAWSGEQSAYRWLSDYASLPRLIRMAKLLKCGGLKRIASSEGGYHDRLAAKLARFRPGLLEDAWNVTEAGIDLEQESESSGIVADPQAVRAWAIAKGHKVAQRGRLPSSLIEQYREVHSASR